MRRLTQAGKRPRDTPGMIGKRRQRHQVRTGGLLALTASALVLASVTRAIERQVESPFPLAPTEVYHPMRAQLDGSGAPVSGGRPIPIEVPFERGETVSDVLATLDLEPVDVESVVAELARFADLRRIRPRDRYAVIGEEGRLDAFQLTVDGVGRAAVRRTVSGWRGEWRAFERRRTIHRIEGRLENSLEGALRAAGAEPALAYRMADVLQWDLDFTRDLRTGDAFEVLFEAVHLDGAYHSLGEILALGYDNRGRRLEAYRYGVGDRFGYYDGDGRPLRKMFLRSPVKYSRVTSRFSHRRFHPVLKTHRPHYGVDYGAPTGTPVRVTGNGVVLSAGWNGGGGRTVKVRHPNGYVTAYLHLSRYAKGVRSGRRVQQGDVIGFVGSSGLSTGPHLDYRIQHHGRWIDPLALQSLPAEPIADSDLPGYLLRRDELRAALAGTSELSPPPASGARYTLASEHRDGYADGDS